MSRRGDDATTDFANWPPPFGEQMQAELAADPSPLAALYRQAYDAYPAWLAYLRTDQTPVAQETLTVCERLLEMAEAIFVAGYVSALVDTDQAGDGDNTRD